MTASSRGHWGRGRAGWRGGDIHAPRPVCVSGFPRRARQSRTAGTAAHRESPCAHGLSAAALQLLTMAVHLIGGPFHGDGGGPVLVAITSSRPDHFCLRGNRDALWHHYQATLATGEYLYLGVCDDVPGQHRARTPLEWAEAETA